MPSTGVPWVDTLLQAKESPAVPPAERSTEEWIRHFRSQSENPRRAFGAALQARSRDPRNLNLRDAEHALFSQHTLRDYGPVLGRALLGGAVPGYTVAKVLAQNYPAVEPLIRLLSGMDLRQSTRPDFSELYWGLRPLLGELD